MIIISEVTAVGKMIHKWHIDTQGLEQDPYSNSTDSFNTWLSQFGAKYYASKLYFDNDEDAVVFKLKFNI